MANLLIFGAALCAHKVLYFENNFKKKKIKWAPYTNRERCCLTQAIRVSTSNWADDRFSILQYLPESRKKKLFLAHIHAMNILCVYFLIRNITEDWYPKTLIKGSNYLRNYVFKSGKMIESSHTLIKSLFKFNEAVIESNQRARTL